MQRVINVETHRSPIIDFQLVWLQNFHKLSKFSIFVDSLEGLPMAARSSRKKARVQQSNALARPVKKTSRRASDDTIEGMAGGPVQSQDEAVTSSMTPTKYSATPSHLSKKRKQDMVQDESDPEYETIKVRKGHPSLRDPSELPIIVEHGYSGQRKVLWAKMDTGADVNVMAAKVVERLGLSSKITKSHIGLGEIGGNGVDLDQKISISFWAGRKNLFCEEVDFFVPKEQRDTDADGIPDVLLGLPELRKHHMITVDPDFANEPEEGLEVLAKRAEDEGNGERQPAIFLGKKYPQVVKR